MYILCLIPYFFELWNGHYSLSKTFSARPNFAIYNLPFIKAKQEFKQETLLLYNIPQDCLLQKISLQKLDFPLPFL